MAKWLSRRPAVGGSYLLFMALFVVGIMLLVLFRAPGEDNEIVFSGLIPLFIAFFWPGMWLIRRRRKYVKWLEEPLEQITGVIELIRPVPYLGNRAKIKIPHTADQTHTVYINFLGKPDWEAGKEIPLVKWENGRLCPRYFDFMVDFVYLPSPQRDRQFRRQTAIGIGIFLSLAVCGFIIGIYGQTQ